MTFDFMEKSKVKIKMDDYIESMMNESPMRISNSDTYLNPAGSIIFEKGNRKRLGKKETEELQTLVSRGMFVARKDFVGECRKLQGKWIRRK